MRTFLVVLIAMLVTVSFGFCQTAIHDIQYVTDPTEDDTSPEAGNTVTIQGWVTFEPMSGGGDLWFVADEAGAWNGIGITGEPEMQVGFGWQVTVTGVVEENDGMTVLDITNEENPVTVDNDEVNWTQLPAACAYTVVSTGDLSAPGTGEQYEGVLVKLENVHCSNIDMGDGEWEVSDGTAVRMDNPRDDVYGYVCKPSEDMEFEYVQGVLNHSGGLYKILPEIAHDLKVNQDPDDNGEIDWYTPFAYFQQVRPMDMTVLEDDQGDLYTWDYSYSSSERYNGDDENFPPDTLTLHGIITMPTGLSYAGAGVKFIFSDYGTVDQENPGFSEPWSAVLSYDPDPTAYGDLYIGDEIVVRGYISEYSQDAGNMTELFVTDPVDVLSFGLQTATPNVINTADLRNTQTAEQWGNVMVEIQNAIITVNNPQYGLFTIDNDLQDEWIATKVGSDSDSLNDYPTMPVGLLLESITGWVYHHYGNHTDTDGTDWTYKIEPLYPEDIVIGAGPPVFATTSRSPGAPSPSDEVTVTSMVADNSLITRVDLLYREGFEGEWNTINMDDIGGGYWECDIPSYPEGTDIWYYVEAEDDSSNITTYPMDIEQDLMGYWSTEFLGIYEVQYTPMPSGNTPYEGVMVTVSGVVTTSPENALEYGSSYGEFNTYFIQTGDTAPFSGICFNVPYAMDQPALGDLVSVTGTATDHDPDSYSWNDGTKLVDVVQVSVESSGNDFTVYARSIAELNAALEEYESVFVELSGLTVTVNNPYDWTVTDGSGEEFLIDNSMIYEVEAEEWFSALEPGMEITQVRGVVAHTYGTWKVEPRGLDDLGETSVGEENSPLPCAFTLEPVYPNPFNPAAYINYTLPHSGRVRLAVFNTMGRLVSTVVDADQRAGEHTACWNGVSNDGFQAASGTYFLRLELDGRQQVRKMVLVK